MRVVTRSTVAVHYTAVAVKTNLAVAVEGIIRLAETLLLLLLLLLLQLLLLLWV